MLDKRSCIHIITMERMDTYIYDAIFNLWYIIMDNINEPNMRVLSGFYIICGEVIYMNKLGLYACTGIQ